ncbi:MAG: NmrA family NAD(P)-binding protein [Nitrosopumilus sp.]|jgi:NADH dehydrogenase|nr:NmrA family NAD(P)-binding protein [Nitrosopumilus sp.]MBT3925095.1 NmrA family NAD(P)-binding protein [Nitrosopumilus sp.]MBT4216646.1 NmrA family NAD(P)-binding protein [Nitrosopumilus sp.]MBT4551327.1 NmrA family NAD(P)-binding protein [Nitrosopumilus sp.]MBT7473089.1 NmrA family NAD(P)-binding protein [Nitrosopumilus sp.]
MAKRIKVTVTGANGFVAKNLRKYLSKHNIDLISISRSNFKEYDNEVKIISKSYDEKIIINKIKNSDVLIHLVGIGKQSVNIDYEMINVEFTKHLVNLARKAKIKKIIYNSGLGVSSKTSVGYFISKYKAEKIIMSSGLNYTIFRPSYIVGKDDLFTKFLKKQIKLKIIEIPGSGNYSIQPISINDVVKVFHQSLDQIKFKNKIIDLVGPDYLTFEQYVKLFSKNTGTKIKKINLENAYYDAITNSKSNFGVDDLNILIGDFKGNYNKLQKITQMKFESVIELLKSGRLL